MVANCVSFGYDPNTPSCELYSAPVRNQKWTSDAAATKTYANRNCYSCTDASTYTVHVPEPTQYVPDRMFQQSFGFDPGYIQINEGDNYLQSYDTVFTWDGDANDGFNYFEIVLNPPEDGTWAEATYAIEAQLIPDNDYTFSVAAHPGRDRLASSDTLPNCQAQAQVTDYYSNLLGSSGDYQDLPEGWSTLSASFHAGIGQIGEAVTLTVNIQCAVDDYPSIWLDSLSVDSGTPAIRGQTESKLAARKIDPQKLPHKNAVGKIDPHKLNKRRIDPHRLPHKNAVGKIDPQKLS